MGKKIEQRVTARTLDEMIQILQAKMEFAVGESDDESFPAQCVLQVLQFINGVFREMSGRVDEVIVPERDQRAISNHG